LFIPVSVVKKVELFSLSLYPPAKAGFSVLYFNQIRICKRRERNRYVRRSLL